MYATDCAERGTVLYTAYYSRLYIAFSRHKVVVHLGGFDRIPKAKLYDGRSTVMRLNIDVHHDKIPDQLAFRFSRMNIKTAARPTPNGAPTQSLVQRRLIVGLS